MSREGVPEVLHIAKMIFLEWDSVGLCHAGAGSIGRAATQVLGTVYHKRGDHGRGTLHNG